MFKTFSPFLKDSISRLYSWLDLVGGIQNLVIAELQLLLDAEKKRPFISG